MTEPKLTLSTSRAYGFFTSPALLMGGPLRSLLRLGGDTWLISIEYDPSRGTPLTVQLSAVEIDKKS